MKDISEYAIREMVADVIKKIPPYYRCYELMRKLQEVFHQEGIKLKIKDGSVLYCPMTLFKEAAKGNCKALKLDVSVQDVEIARAAQLAAEKANGKDLGKVMDWRIIINHSWGILPKEKLLVDCHASIDLSHSTSIPLFEEFPVLRKVRFENLIRIIPFSKPLGRSEYLLGNDIFIEIATQKGNVIKYPGGHNISLRL